MPLDSSGYFTRDGGRFIPMGANYWPASSGVEMWQRFDEGEIAGDLRLIRSLGLNTVRFFLRWQDFEPRPGQYDRGAFAKLGRVLQLCRDEGVVAHPSLFVGFMSGGIFWPEWRAGRNVFADADMAAHAADFARAAATAIAPYEDVVLAIDQGNELCCLPDSQAAPPAAVVAWCASVNAAIRSVMPQAILISGNEQNQVVNDTGWRFGSQPGCDLYSMHGYPVPSWHSVSFDGMTDPLCQSLLPFYTKIARAFGPVMLQEFGTIVTFGQRQQDEYLRAMLPAAWEAGANGFLWWCLRDITARVHPYLKNGFEATLGLVDANNRVKPGLEFFVEFARSIGQRPIPQAVAAGPGTLGPIGIYLPRHYYPRDNPENPGNDPRKFSRWLVVANHLLGHLGHQTRVVRGDATLPADLRTLVIPGALVTAQEASSLEPWVAAGGRLIWHGPDPVNWGPEYIRLLGAACVDYRGPMAARIDAFGATFEVAAYPRDMRAQVEARGAKIVATDQKGLPAILSHSMGRGRVVCALPLMDEAIAGIAHDRELRDAWGAWYAGMIDLLVAA